MDKSLIIYLKDIKDIVDEKMTNPETFKKFKKDKLTFSEMYADIYNQVIINYNKKIQKYNKLLFKFKSHVTLVDLINHIDINNIQSSRFNKYFYNDFSIYENNNLEKLNNTYELDLEFYYNEKYKLYFVKKHIDNNIITNDIFEMIEKNMRKDKINSIIFDEYEVNSLGSGINHSLLYLFCNNISDIHNELLIKYLNRGLCSETYNQISLYNIILYINHNKSIMIYNKLSDTYIPFNKNSIDDFNLLKSLLPEKDKNFIFLT